MTHHCTLPGDECDREAGCDTCQHAKHTKNRRQIAADVALDTLISSMPEDYCLPPIVVRYLVEYREARP